MKKSILILGTLFAFVLLLTGCEKEEEFQTIGQFTGKWEGTLLMPTGEVLPINLDLEQKGSYDLEGYFIVLREDYRVLYALKDLSRVMDNTIIIYFDAKYEYVLTGVLDSSGKRIEGTYTTDDIPGANKVWSVNKVE